MDKNRGTTGGYDDIPKPQSFNGREYKLYKGERYYSRGDKRLHRVVWEYHNGRIPNGYHIHHVDGDTTNNDISNLNLVRAELHLRFEANKRVRENPEHFINFQKSGCDSAREWHGSEEGREWHSKQSKEMWRVREYTECVCECCGEIYESRHKGKKRFCSNKCSSKSRRDSGVDNEIRKCEICKQGFEISKYRKKPTCSRECGRVYRYKTNG